MASYRVVWKRSAEKELRGFSRETIARLIDLAEGLRNDPYPPGVIKLTGAERTYRVRSGDYRLVYTVAGEQPTVEVVKVGHRRDVYR